MTFMLLIHIRKIEEDDPNNLGRLSKEVLAQDEYRGRNLFYYVFAAVNMMWNSERIIIHTGSMVCFRL